MNRVSIITRKIIGNAKVTNDPDKMATPNSTAVIPRYIGFRLMRKGPEVMSEVGEPRGDTVVLR